MDPALGTALTGAVEQGGFALIAILLLWFTMRELKEFLKAFDSKLDKQSASIARLLRALGEDE